MKHILTHIVALLFLLLFAGSRLLDISQNTPSVYSTIKVSTTQVHSVKTVEHKITKENHADYSYSSIETDANEFELSDPVMLLAIFTKLVVFAYAFSYFLKRLRKRRFFYKAYIRIFSQKYLVLRTLRI